MKPRHLSYLGRNCLRKDILLKYLLEFSRIGIECFLERIQSFYDAVKSLSEGVHALKRLSGCASENTLPTVEKLISLTVSAMSA